MQKQVQLNILGEKDVNQAKLIQELQTKLATAEKKVERHTETIFEISRKRDEEKDASTKMEKKLSSEVSRLMKENIKVKKDAGRDLMKQIRTANEAVAEMTGIRNKKLMAHVAVWFQKTRSQKRFSWYEVQLEELKEERADLEDKVDTANDSARRGWKQSKDNEKEIALKKKEIEEYSLAFKNEKKSLKKKFKEDAKKMVQDKCQPVAVRQIKAFDARWDKNGSTTVLMCWRQNWHETEKARLRDDREAEKKGLKEATERGDTFAAKYGLEVIHKGLLDFIHQGLKTALDAWREEQMTYDRAKLREKLDLTEADLVKRNEIAFAKARSSVMRALGRPIEGAWADAIYKWRRNKYDAEKAGAFLAIKLSDALDVARSSMRHWVSNVRVEVKIEKDELHRATLRDLQRMEVEQRRMNTTFMAQKKEVQNTMDAFMEANKKTASRLTGQRANRDWKKFQCTVLQLMLLNAKDCKYSELEKINHKLKEDLEALEAMGGQVVARAGESAKDRKIREAGVSALKVAALTAKAFMDAGASMVDVAKAAGTAANAYMATEAGKFEGITPEYCGKITAEAVKRAGGNRVLQTTEAAAAAGASAVEISVMSFNKEKEEKEKALAMKEDLLLWEDEKAEEKCIKAEATAKLNKEPFNKEYHMSYHYEERKEHEKAVEVAKEALETARDNASAGKGHFIPLAAQKAYTTYVSMLPDDKEGATRVSGVAAGVAVEASGGGLELLRRRREARVLIPDLEKQRRQCLETTERLEEEKREVLKRKLAAQKQEMAESALHKELEEIDERVSEIEKRETFFKAKISEIQNEIDESETTIEAACLKIANQVSDATGQHMHGAGGTVRNIPVVVGLQTGKAAFRMGASVDGAVSVSRAATRKYMIKEDEDESQVESVGEKTSLLYIRGNISAKVAGIWKAAKRFAGWEVERLRKLVLRWKYRGFQFFGPFRKSHGVDIFGAMIRPAHLKTFILFNTKNKRNAWHALCYAKQWRWNMMTEFYEKTDLAITMKDLRKANVEIKTVTESLEASKAQNKEDEETIGEMNTTIGELTENVSGLEDNLETQTEKKVFEAKQATGGRMASLKATIKTLAKAELARTIRVWAEQTEVAVGLVRSLEKASSFTEDLMSLTLTLTLTLIGE